MSHPVPPTARGYLKRFEIKRNCETPGSFSADVEVELAEGWEEASPITTIRFIDARQVQIGDRDGIDFGTSLFLGISDVSERQWDGIRYEVCQLEQGGRFHLLCRSLEITSGK